MPTLAVQFGAEMKYCFKGITLLCNLLLQIQIFPSISFQPISSPTYHHRQYSLFSSTSHHSRTSLFLSRELISIQPPPKDLQEKIKRVAISLWGGLENIPTIKKCPTNTNPNFIPVEGEADFLPLHTSNNNQMEFSKRGTFFKEQAMNGNPKAQHSYGLLLWNGFSSTNGVAQNAEESAKFHAAAAYQNHLDSIAILGGCLRTGSGIPKKVQKEIIIDDAVQFGIQLIEYCAQEGNPTGINKKAALYEIQDDADEESAFELYKQSYYENGRYNALTLFNLGWYYMNGMGNLAKKEEGRGIELWKVAVTMAPDEGSEESAWFLYDYYKRDEPKEAEKWLQIAYDLGFPDAIDEYNEMKYMFGNDDY